MINEYISFHPLATKAFDVLKYFWCACIYKPTSSVGKLVSFVLIQIQVYFFLRVSESGKGVIDNV